MIVGKRQRSTQGLGRLALLSMSAIALALAFFPVLAHAECTTSSCVQYSDSLPEAGGEGNPSHHPKQTPAKASKTGTNSAGSDNQESKDAESGESESSKRGGAAGGGNEGGPPQGNAGGSHNGKSGAMAHPGDHSASNASGSQSSGGSSPLVPILIAIAVLAAISVGIVLYRQRRQRRGPGTSASPEAS